MTTPQAAPRGPNPKGAKSTATQGAEGATTTQTQQKTSPTAAAPATKPPLADYRAAAMRSSTSDKAPASSVRQPSPTAPPGLAPPTPVVLSATAVGGKPLDIKNRDLATLNESRRLFLCAHDEMGKEATSVCARLKDGTELEGTYYAGNIDKPWLTLRFHKVVKAGSGVPLNLTELGLVMLSDDLEGYTTLTPVKETKVTGTDGTPAAGQGGFMTDTDISGRRGAQGGDRRLQRLDDSWLAATVKGEDLSGSVGHFDQFETNRLKFGVSSTFDEELYTTAVPKVTAEKEAKAAKLAREIEHERTANPHLAEERGQGGYENMDEEDRFSFVLKSGPQGNKVGPKAKQHQPQGKHSQDARVGPMGGGPSMRSGGEGKYVPPALRQHSSPHSPDPSAATPPPPPPKDGGKKIASPPRVPSPPPPKAEPGPSKEVDHPISTPPFLPRSPHLSPSPPLLPSPPVSSPATKPAPSLAPPSLAKPSLSAGPSLSGAKSSTLRAVAAEFKPREYKPSTPSGPTAMPPPSAHMPGPHHHANPAHMHPPHNTMVPMGGMMGGQQQGGVAMRGPQVMYQNTPYDPSLGGPPPVGPNGEAVVYHTGPPPQGLMAAQGQPRGPPGAYLHQPPGPYAQYAMTPQPHAGPRGAMQGPYQPSGGQMMGGMGTQATVMYAPPGPHYGDGAGGAMPPPPMALPPGQQQQGAQPLPHHMYPPQHMGPGGRVGGPPMSGQQGAGGMGGVGGPGYQQGGRGGHMGGRMMRGPVGMEHGMAEGAMAHPGVEGPHHYPLPGEDNSPRHHPYPHPHHVPQLPPHMISHSPHKDPSDISPLGPHAMAYPGGGRGRGLGGRGMPAKMDSGRGGRGGVKGGSGGRGGSMGGRGIAGSGPYRGPPSSSATSSPLQRPHLNSGTPSSSPSVGPQATPTPAQSTPPPTAGSGEAAPPTPPAMPPLET